LFLFIGRNVVVALPCKEYTACLVVEWPRPASVVRQTVSSGRCDMMTDDSRPLGLGKPNATFRLGYRSV